MRFLLTGGAGYIGSHTCVSLLNAGHDIVVIDNLSNSSPVAIERVEEITGKKIAFYVGDCCDEDFLNEVLDNEQVDAAVHFAGLKAVGESVSIPLRYYKNNIDSTIALCNALAAHNVKRIVFSSSATVYGNSEIVPMREDLPLGVCTNPYGWTKWMNEQILRDLHVSDPEWSVVLLRYFNPVGAHESGKIGEDPSGIPNNLMPFICQTAAGIRKELSIFGNDYDTPDGTCVRDYIHVMDLADGHLKALEYATVHQGVETFNLGTGEGYSVYQMVAAFERANHLSLPHRDAPRRPGDIAQSYADPAKANRILGWKATHTLDDMCRDAWNWQSHNPTGYPKEDA
ncbi:MAG: UDP-glucose 4-epimerase GalE [Clostridia bacterium]|nr:UDP-glucose 4-epimerase GalE [Clostridia bacterium]